MSTEREKAPSPSIFEQWCHVTAYHGILDFHLAKSYIAKAFWSVVITTGLFFTINQTAELVLSFALEDGWLTSVSTEMPPEGVLKWPNITICNLGTFSKRKLGQLGLRGRAASSLVDVGTSQEQVDFFSALEAEIESDNGDQISDGRVLSSKQRLMAAQFTCEDTLVHCGPNVGLERSFPDCNCSSFSQSSYYVGCFRLRTDNIAKAGAVRNKTLGFESQGYSSGMQLLLNPNLDDYYPVVMYRLKPVSGLSLLVYFGEDDGDELLSPIHMSPSSHVVIAMTAQKHRVTIRPKRAIKFYEPKPPCMQKPGYQVLNTTIVSKSLCQLDCRAQIRYHTCPCVPDVYRMPVRNDIRICTDEERVQCQKSLRHADPTIFNVSRCVELCQDPCEFESVETRVSTAQFPAAPMLTSFTSYLNKVLGRSGNMSFSQHEVGQLIFLEMFYERSEYLVTEKVDRQSMDEMISAIGGTLGVWTGISFITLLQFLVYLLDGLGNLSRKLWCSNRITDTKLR